MATFKDLMLSGKENNSCILIFTPNITSAFQHSKINSIQCNVTLNGCMQGEHVVINDDNGPDYCVESELLLQMAYVSDNNINILYSFLLDPHNHKFHITYTLLFIIAVLCVFIFTIFSIYFYNRYKKNKKMREYQRITSIPIGKPNITLQGICKILMTIRKLFQLSTYTLAALPLQNC